LDPEVVLDLGVVEQMELSAVVVVVVVVVVEPEGVSLLLLFRTCLVLM
jgi:hypothetical protein